MTDKWIVTFEKDFDPVNYHWPNTIKICDIHKHAHHGMCCTASEAVLKDLQLDKKIKSYVKDSIIKIQSLPARKILNNDVLSALAAAQPIGPFIRRIGSDHSSQISGDGIGSLSNRTDINVFIVDTGISQHVDLNIVGGRNFTTTDPNAWNDGNGHGTHVAGIVGAKDNTYGIVGVAPGVRLWAIKVLNDSGSGSVSNIITALNWILANKNILWSGYAILNMSLGGSAIQVLDDAVNNLINAGIIVCVAAGNNSINAINVSPARVVNAITVGATGTNSTYNSLAPYSNFGSIVDILAPGTNIYSTYLNNGYATLSGTSMATPVLTGTVVLLLNKYNLSQFGINNIPQFTREIIYSISSNTIITNNDRTIGSNPRISIPVTKPTTNVSVWAGAF